METLKLDFCFTRKEPFEQKGKLTSVMSLALPNRQRRPANRRQINDGLSVPPDVATKFGAPILYVAFWHPRALTPLMPMPEASMHEQGDAVFWKHYVWIAGEIAAMESES